MFLAQMMLLVHFLFVRKALIINAIWAWPEKRLKKMNFVVDGNMISSYSHINFNENSITFIFEYRRRSALGEYAHAAPVWETVSYCWWTRTNNHIGGPGLRTTPKKIFQKSPVSEKSPGFLFFKPQPKISEQVFSKRF